MESESRVVGGTKGFAFVTQRAAPRYSYGGGLKVSWVTVFVMDMRYGTECRLPVSSSVIVTAHQGHVLD